MVTKELILQYNDMQEEIKQIRCEIQRTEESIAKLIEEGTVCDKVKGGLGGIQGFKIEGFPISEYNRREKILRSKHNRLAKKENDLLELKEDIERFIDNIDTSRDRRIFMAVYIEKKTQQQIADELHIDRSLVSKIIGKYI